MALKLSTPLKNTIVNSVITAIAGTIGTSGTANVKVYTGTQPSDADAAVTGSLICTIAGIGYEASTNGSCRMSGTAGDGTKTGTASSDGTAGWACIETITSAGTMRIDGSVGTAMTSTFWIDSTVVTAGHVVELYDSFLQ